MNTVDVGKFIAEQRKKKSLTQKELAAMLHVTDKAVSKWETGKCYPDIEIIERLSGIFEVSIHEILSGKRIEPENQIEEAEKNVIQVMKTSENNQRKWKRISLIFILMTICVVLFLIVFGTAQKREEHQVLTSAEAAFDAEKILRISIPEIGLKNVLIHQLDDNILLADGQCGTVYLLADDRYGDGSQAADYYLAVLTNDKIVAKDLSAWQDQSSYDGTFYCVDLDGDEDKEIVLQENIGLSGGAGQYLSRIFDFRDGEIIEIFSSIANEEVFDTGFSLTLLKDKQFRIENRFTGYHETFTLSGRDENYYNQVWLQDKIELSVDTFYTFEPYDADHDGVYEIRCCQYTSLYGHSDYIGTAVSFLKYDKEKAAFVVCDAYFETEKIN